MKIKTNVFQIIETKEFKIYSKSNSLITYVWVSLLYTAHIIITTNDLLYYNKC